MRFITGDRYYSEPLLIRCEESLCFFCLSSFGAEHCYLITIQHQRGRHGSTRTLGRKQQQITTPGHTAKTDVLVQPLLNSLSSQLVSHQTVVEDVHFFSRWSFLQYVQSEVVPILLFTCNMRDEITTGVLTINKSTHKTILKELNSDFSSALKIYLSFPSVQHFGATC